MALVIKSDAIVTNIGSNVKNSLDYKTSNELVADYVAKVTADGGVINNMAYLQNLANFLVDKKLAGKVHTIISSSLGVKKHPSSNTAETQELVSKLFNFVGEGDYEKKLYEKITGTVDYTKDISSDVSDANATVRNSPYMYTDGSRLGITCNAASDTRNLGFSQSGLEYISANKTLAVLAVIAPITTVNLSIFPLSFTDTENLYENGGSTDFTMRMVLNPGASRTFGLRASTIATTPLNGINSQHIYTPSESACAQDKVACIYVNSEDRVSIVSSKVSGSYIENTSTISEELSDNFNAMKQMNIFGEARFGFQKFAGRLYDIFVLRDCTIEEMRLVRSFLDSVVR